MNVAKAIAIKIDEGSFRELHIQAAKKKLSIERYVTDLIELDLFRNGSLIGSFR